MRRASKSRLDLVAQVAALTLGLTGCSVDVEGATCQVVGAVGNCPSGQACGTDLKCSVAAAACTPCVAGALECRAGSIDVMTCSAASDAACGSWTVATACMAGQQVCQAPAVGDPTCVYLEGRSCSVTGSTAGCPTGQACGTGLTCSVAAAACTPCVGGARSCQAGSTDVKTCTAAVDPACGTWVVAAGDACPAGQACRGLPVSGTPACVCDAWTVVPGGSAAACTRPSIASAIAEAVKFPAPLVHLGGASPAVYGNELDDAAPIVIPAGVTLVGDESMPAAATNRIISVRGPGPEGLLVQAGAVVWGIAVQRDAAAANELTVGVLLPGGSVAGGNTLVAVRVDAQGTGGGFSVGLRVAGANTIAVSDVLVRGATVAGLEVNRLAASDVVLVTDSTFDQNQVGVNLLRGDLTLARTVVKRSVAEGVVAATGTPGQTSLTLVDDLISWNGRGGVRLSVNETLSITGTRICKNVGVDRSLSGVTRSVGGIYGVGTQPTSLNFRGNLIHDNGGDQVYVGAATTPWDLSGAPGCMSADRNVFANFVAPGVGLAAVGATVNALFNSWQSSLPLVGADYFAAAGGMVDAGTGGGATDFCLPALPADLTCPAP